MAIATDITKDRDVEVHLDGELHRAVQRAVRRIRDREPLQGRVRVKIRPNRRTDHDER